MARPNKIGLDYFPFDIDFFDDEKISAISGEFGIKGEITVIRLLCAIYRNGYFILWDDLLRYKLLRNLPGTSEHLLESIVQRLVLWGFFDKSLFDSAGVLTSKGIQRRFFSITKRRVSEVSELPYLLVSAYRNPAKLGKNELLHTETPVKEEFLHTKTPKVKKSKEKNILSPLQEIVELWNSTCTAFPKVQILNDARKQKIKLRLAEWGKTPEEQLSVAADIFRKIQASNFLRGENSNGWQATFDWLFSNSTNSSKVIEGNYENRGKPVQSNKLNTRNVNSAWE